MAVFVKEYNDNIITEQGEMLRIDFIYESKANQVIQCKFGR